ncbi:Protein atonal -like protein 8 [Trichinella zimbabwensis]|uniref:Protein atonal-like protein 8 n=1 Tax=Trichinella zimbabwensis TaxID=268475 RepID=A0A0V1H3T7_9BILA|nr:Protein atonal -like protein 8 [Trichinella zimbabwensis]
MVIVGGDEIMETSMEKVDNIHQEIDDDEDEELIIVDDDDVYDSMKEQSGIVNNTHEEEKPLDLSTKRRCRVDIQTTAIAVNRGGSVYFPINPQFNVSPLTLLPSQLPMLLCSPWTELFQAGRIGWLHTITPRTLDLIRQTQPQPPLYHANSSTPASMVFQFYNQTINNNNNNNNKQFTSPIASPSSCISSSSSSVASSSSSSHSSNSLLSTTIGGNKRKLSQNKIAFQNRRVSEKFLHPRRHRAKNPTVRRMVANFRERCRVHMISEAFESLRVALPTACPAQKLTKVSILRIASIYIMLLGAMNGRDYSADQSKPTVDQLQQLLAETIYNETNLRC